MRDFEQIDLWQRARKVVREVYRASSGPQNEERWFLGGQMSRAPLLICANIAEGVGRSHAGDPARFLPIGHGSACELRSHLVLGADLGIVPPGAADRISRELGHIRRMPGGWIRAIRRSQRS